jgi:hypothetical protein
LEKKGFLIPKKEIVCPSCKRSLEQFYCKNCDKFYRTIQHKNYLIPIFADLDQSHIKPHREFSNLNAGVLSSGEYFRFPPSHTYRHFEERFISSRLNELEESFRKTPNILDLGCGDGRYLKLLSSFKDLIITG